MIVLNRRFGVRILCYHGITERKIDPVLERNLHTAAEFRRHLQLLSPFEVISLDEVLQRRHSQRRSSAVAITFDDGYANNVLAAELLSEKRLPYTVFVTTGEIGKRRTIWTVELSLLLLQGDAASIELLGQRYALSTREARVATFRSVRQVLKMMPARVRAQEMDTLRAAFPAGETERLVHQFNALSMMDWHQVRQLSAAGVEIGSHGVWHEIHHEQQEPQVIREELRQSKTVLEGELGKPCRFFAYPNGNTNNRSEPELAAAGYNLGVTTKPGALSQMDSWHALPRLDPQKSLRALFKQMTVPDQAI